MKHLVGGLALAAIALAVAGPASAVVTFSKTPLFTPDTLTTVATFDSPTAAGYQFSVTGATVPLSGVFGPGLVPGIAAPPGGPLDSTKFFAVIGGDPSDFVTFESDNATPLALSKFRFDVSSVDTYNSISFLDKTGATLASYTGNDLTNPPGHANGDQFSTVTSLRLTFSDFSAPVAKVVFQSSQNSFEFDNVGVLAASTRGGGPAPEPTTWMMLLAGFGMLGLALRSRSLGSVFAGA
jgi:PEP-CTERM motif